ncbi:hypothetical protein [uncultured Chryseobacterium sp.]|uniref:phosphoribosyltransferase-like protein n=1 Tax=Chryseobacterium sp. sg2396 TaxID=3276280 RepID=UPI00258996B4|nr:hypothetical protein [uncultured Chryseobacterium sp.]
MGSTYKYTEDSIRQIEFLIPRLKYSLYPTKIIQWLENFDGPDVPFAIDILRIFEYISFPEFMFRLDSLLKELLKKIPKEDKIIIFPYGKIGKSGTLVTYPLRNTSAFKRREANILLTHDFKYIKDSEQYKHIIFLDDFIGSGKTFCDEFEGSGVKDWILKNNIEKIYLLSAIIMNEGKKKIEGNYSKIKIVSEVRHKLFDENFSPYKAFSKNTYKSVKNIVNKYGKKIIVNRPPNQFLPFGYGNSESTIAFFHGTPNNTISLIWGKTKEWKALYPRKVDVRMSEARELKKEINYYLSICEKLGININSGINLIDKMPDRRKETTRRMREQNQAAITVLFLKNKSYENIYVCQILGITREELKYIFIELRNKGLVTNDYKSITNSGKALLLELNKVTKSEKIRNETENNLTIKKHLYLPQMFKGLT